MTSLINSCPREILRLILRHVQLSADIYPQPSFVEYLTVCSLWHEVGAALIYTDVVLNSWDLSLAKFGNCDTDKLALVRSLTIKILMIDNWNPLPTAPGSIEIWEVPQSLTSITHQVGLMRLLETFSFLVMVSNLDTGASHALSLRQEDIGGIITALPSTLEHLEIDTKGYDRMHFLSDHLCPKIRDRFCQLRTIRLRLASLCLSLLPNGDLTSTRLQTFPLQNAVINLTHYPRASTTFLCSDMEIIAECTSWSSTFHEQRESCRRLRRALATRLLQTLFSGIIPSVARLSVFETVYPPETEEDTFNMVNERDFIAWKTVSNPFYTLRTGGVALRWQDPFGNQIEVFGDCFEVEKLAEGEAWIETIAGSRFPASFRKSQRCRNGHYVWSAPLVKYKEAFEGTSRALGWWDYEEWAGRNLLCVRVCEGVGDVAPLERELSQLELDEAAEDEEISALMEGVFYGAW